jgi:transcription factor C subunit 7
MKHREWFGASTYFDHPPPASPSKLRTYFPSIITAATEHKHKAHVIPSTRGETIPQLHNRVATALAGFISDVDAQVQAEEAQTGKESSKAILICSHAAPLIAMGRALTGNVPEDVNTEDFHVYTAGLSTFVRRRQQSESVSAGGTGGERSLLAAGTRLVPENEVQVPDWKNGKGVGGGWDCVSNGDCSFLSGGEERGW